MSLHEVTGVILNRRDVREDSRLYTVLTHERGKLEVFGRGIKKAKAKLGGHLEPGATVKLTLVQGKTGETITAVERLYYPNAVMQSLEKLATLGFILNLVDSVTKAEAQDIGLASFLQEAIGRLESLSEEKNKQARFRMWFTWHVFNLIGLGPELQTCVHCRKSLSESGVKFSPLLGGWLGMECRDFDDKALVVESQTRDFVRVLNRSAWEETELFKIDNGSEKTAAQITLSEMHHVLEKHLPSEKFIDFVRHF
ncbi:MAG: DNA repair protein RecO [Patescibacteria group bacterium]|jgi:DNA repair protein RecO